MGTSDVKRQANTSETARRHLLYDEYARDYSNRFRAAIDFEHAEEPRQIIGMSVLLGFCIILGLYWSFTSKEYALQAASQVSFGCFVFGVLVYSFLQTRDGLLVRPHPGFWRICHGIGLAHLLFFVTLAGLPTKFGKQLVGLLLPGVSTLRDVFSGTCDLQCELSTRTLLIQMKKMWFYSHLLGWFAKMCIFRDWSFCLVLSIAFETVELSFQWLIPELRECWWDSIFLDFTMSNMIGMLVGAATLRVLNVVCYDWLASGTSISRTPSTQKLLQLPSVKSVVRRFTPFTWRQYHWAYFRTPERMVQAALLVVVALLTELNVFLMMYALDIPASHWFHKARVTYLCFLAIPGVAESYHYVMQDGKTQPRRIGHNAWLFVACITTEFIVSLRYGKERFPSMIPEKAVLIPWVISFSLLFAWSYCHFVIVGPNRLDVPRDLWSALSRRCKEPDSAVENATRTTSAADSAASASAFDATESGGLHNRKQDAQNSLDCATPDTQCQTTQRQRQNGSADAEALRCLMEFVSFHGLQECLSGEQLAFSADEVREQLKQMRQARKHWGRFVYDFALTIVMIPPLMAFLPLIYLVRFYDW